MCGCLFVLLAAFAPRLILVMLWFFTDLVARAFSTLFLPVLGIIFLPFTTLIYVLVFNAETGGVAAPMGWLLLCLGLLIDLSAYGGSAVSNRGRFGR